MNRTTSEGSEGLAGAALDGVLAELCDLKRTALLASPYLAFETRFLGREGNELRMWATMSRSMVENTLTQQALRIRFPWALSMWAGFTRVLGYEQGEKQRFVRLAVPERIGIDELRGHYRTDQCGRSGGTLGSESLDVVRVSVENLSAGGAGLFAQQGLDPESFSPGRSVMFNLQLEGGARIQAGVRIVHQEGFRLGVTFSPPLDGEELARVQEWIRPRRDQAKRAWSERGERRAQAEEAMRAREPEGLLLVTGDPETEAQVRPVLEGLPDLRVAPPVMSGVKKALVPPPLLILLHLPQGGLEDRRRYRALCEAFPACPLILLAGPLGVPLAQELGTELKALNLAWNPGLGAFLRRMVVGLLKKQAGTS